MYNNDSDHYYIHLADFQGPFDLLLYFIERDELDIYDIPITKITNDFLAYIKKMEELNITLASEFIYMAAQLMKIKAKSLLPRVKMQTGEEEEDPKEALIQRLIEYKRFKEISASLAERAALRSQLHARGSLESELTLLSQKAMIEAEWESLTLNNLFSTFQRLMNNLDKKDPPVHHVAEIPYSVYDQKEYIQIALHRKSRLTFRELFSPLSTKMEAIVTFLALLELINDQIVKCKTGEQINDLEILNLKTRQSA